MTQLIGVLGAGNAGLSMAGHLASCGYAVGLWNRTDSDSLSAVRLAQCISLKGEIEHEAEVAIVTTDLEELLGQCTLAIVTVPAHAHRELAQRMAPYVMKHHAILLSPGRTFGSLEFSQALDRHGAAAGYTIAEAQTVVHTSRRLHGNSSHVYGLKTGVPAATLCREKCQAFLKSLPAPLRSCYCPARSILDTGFGNVGMVLHCAPVLLNIGWIESRRTQFRYYYEAITPTVSRLLDKLDAERLAVGKAAGARVVSLRDWLRNVYHVGGHTLYDCLQANGQYASIDAPHSLQHRYLFEDVPTGLVPIESVGQLLDVRTPNITMLIDLAEAILEQDFRNSGRNVNSLSLTAELLKKL